MVRSAVVAGQFYPGRRIEIETDFRGRIERVGPDRQPDRPAGRDLAGRAHDLAGAIVVAGMTPDPQVRDASVLPG